MSKPMTRVPKVGDKIMYIAEGVPYLTKNMVYEVFRVDVDGDAIIKDNGGNDEYINLAKAANYSLVDEGFEDVGFIEFAFDDEIAEDDTVWVEVQVDEKGLGTLRNLATESERFRTSAQIRAQIERLQEQLKEI